MPYKQPLIDDEGRLLCRFCDKRIEPQDLSFVNAYWSGHGSYISSFEHRGEIIHVAAERKFPCHRSCKRAGYRREAFDCQCIDAACNDCKHFQRDGTYAKPDNPFLGPERPSDEDQRIYLLKLIAAGSHFGTCLKFGKPVATNSQRCEMMPCFEHRRAAEYAATSKGQPCA